MYECSECGAKVSKWAGKCMKCGTFGSMVEVDSAQHSTAGTKTGGKGQRFKNVTVAPASRIKDVKTSSFVRTPTGVGELDRVLGGGLVPGQVILMAGEPGVGKALSLDTPIPTPQGWCRLADVKVGDFVLDPSGGSVEVVAVSKIMNDRPCYKVHVSNGDVFVADGEHNWFCEYRGNKADLLELLLGTDRKDSGKGKKFFTSTFTTDMIHSHQRTKEGFPAFYLPQPKLKNLKTTSSTSEVTSGTKSAAGSAHNNTRGVVGDFTSAGNENLTMGQPLDVSNRGAQLALTVHHLDEEGFTVEGFTHEERCTHNKADIAHAGVVNFRGAFLKDSTPCGCVIAHPIERMSATERLSFVQAVIFMGNKNAPEFSKDNLSSTFSVSATGDYVPLVHGASGAGVQQISGAETGASLSSPELFTFTYNNPLNAYLVASVFKTFGYSTRIENEPLLGEKKNVTLYVDMRKTKPYVAFVEKVDSEPVKCLQVKNDNGLFLVGKNYTVTHNSTLLLKAAQSFTGSSHESAVNPSGSTDGRKVLYVSGEESIEQISLRAKRIGAEGANIYLADETDMEKALAHIGEVKPDLVIVDSIQTIASPYIDGRVGGMAQVHEVSNTLTRLAKSSKIPMVIVGQINKSNDLAGPKTLEHLVDTVLMFEGDTNSGLRLLRSVKNRFGAADEIACFEQTERGVEEVVDPSGLFLTERETPAVGVTTAVTLEGRRPLTVEVQALSSFTNSPNPRRGVSGLDYNRVAMLIAVTEKYGRVKFYDKDTFIATVGGVRISEPAIDLSICAALLSTYFDSPFPSDSVLIGEVTLSGDVRRVRNFQQRVAEAKRLGYGKVFLPKNEHKPEGLVSVPIRHVSELREIF